MSEEKKAPRWWKIYTFFFPVRPLTLFFLLVHSYLFATNAALQRYTPHEFMHVWNIQPTFGLPLFLLLTVNFALDIWTYVRKGSPGEDALKEQTILHMLYVGLREEPIFNWLMVYVVASFLNIANRYLPLREVLEPILTGERFPLVGVPRENWWTIAIAIFAVSFVFGWSHVDWGDEKLTRGEKIHWFFSISGKGLCMAMLNYYFGIIPAMIFHSSFDTAVKIITLLKQK